MIASNELRIGNWVQYDDGTKLRVRSIEQNKIGLEGFPQAVDNSVLFPIKLTGEILEKCGFKKEDGPFGQYEYTLKFGYDGILGYRKGFCEPYWYIANNSDDFYETQLVVQYVHQLQTLYFALTQKELSL